MMKKSSIIYLLIITLLSIIIGLTVNHCKSISKAENDTIVKVYYDTVYHTILKTIEKPKVVNKAIIKHDTIFAKDTLVVLPYERKWHKDTVFFSENDTAVIETVIVGINPSIERINALLKKRQINQHSQTIITKKVKQKGFFIAPAITAGYSPFHNNVDLVVGISVGYKF